MMVSTRGRYALRLMLDVAEYQDADGYVSLKDAAERQEISKKYAEQIVTIPGVSRMLESKGGKNGGYRLAGQPSDYTVGDVLRAAEGSMCPVSCLEESASVCARSATCAVLPVWRGLDAVINEYLDGITLQDVLDRKPDYDAGNDYVI
ncbi:MAG: Rrf2 family transcriptional regulator [Clostridia bacterium]|nr:Rrf2 family transcriptional regulator [Clostridia bacterium]